MFLHIRCRNEDLKKLHVKSFKRVKLDKWQDLPYSFSPIDCCVKIEGKPDRLLNDDIQS